MCKTTIKNLLEGEEFDFDNGKIVIRKNGELTDDIQDVTEFINNDFSRSDGIPNFIAQDTAGLYFPVSIKQYSWMVFVRRDIQDYMKHDIPLPDEEVEDE